MKKTENDFSITLTISQPEAVVFNAIGRVNEWWSEEITGSAKQPGDEFFYHYKDVHSCHIRVMEVVPGKKVIWQVLDNFFRFTKDETEWKGTTIVFDIERKGEETFLCFTHIGLNPEYECYQACSAGWTNFISDSLYKLITTGAGVPNPAEGGFNEVNARKWTSL